MEMVEKIDGQWNIDNRLKILHHATRAINIPSILKDGLRPNAPTSNINKKILNRKGVYLTTEQFGWMEWATDGHRYLGATVTIDINGIELIEDSDILVILAVDGSEDDRTLADYLCPNHIPKEHIICISEQRTRTGEFKETIVSKDLYRDRTYPIWV